MDEYEVDILPGEVLSWVREDARKKAPLLYARASREYATETDFDRTEFGIGEGEDVTLVSVHGLLEVSPRQAPGGWTLQLRAEDVVGLFPSGAEEDYENESDMPLEAFEEEFLFPEKGELEAVVLAEDEEAWARFEGWLAEMRKGR
jgi:hypothetical protein